MEDLQGFSRITAGGGHHHEGAGRQTGDRTRGRRQQGLQTRGHLGQRRLLQQVEVRSATRPVLSGSIEELP